MRHAHALTARLSRSAFFGRLLLLAVVTMSTNVAAKELYRWTDDKGVTHYSDTKPAGVAVETRPVTADPVVIVPVEPAPEAAKEEVAKSTPAQATPEQCARVAANLVHLANAPEIRVDPDGDGVPEVLDAAGRQAEVDRNNAFVDKYCSQASPE